MRMSPASLAVPRAERRCDRASCGLANRSTRATSPRSKSSWPLARVTWCSSSVTAAVFDYIVSWATRAAGQTGAIIEVNPEETRLSRIRHHDHSRDGHNGVLPGLVSEWLTGG